MFEVRRSREFTMWLDGLKDRTGRLRIAARIRRMQRGNLGDVRPVGGGVSELRIDHGPGYRVYFVRRGDALFVLLCGGDKGSRRRDIARARALAAEET